MNQIDTENKEIILSISTPTLCFAFVISIVFIITPFKVLNYSLLIRNIAKNIPYIN